MYDATCQRIREVAEEARLPLPDALRPEAIPGPKQMYHVNLSGGGLFFWRALSNEQTSTYRAGVVRVGGCMKGI